MNNKKFIEKSVPKTRLSRFLKLGQLSASITGNVIKNSVTAAMHAEKPSTQNTLLNINNAHSIATHLSQMRGAAMKIGQMLSMDAGELLPKEWEPVLSILREQANIMPKSQLLEMLSQHWGKDWSTQFEYFSFEPIAAASIGQVHRARLKTGEELAIKIQYPGVAKSIDSDIDNVAGLLRLSRLIPKGIDLESLLSQAKIQLKQEADYRSELIFLKRYHGLLLGDNRYLVPVAHEPLCNEFILSMEYIEAQPLEAIEKEPEPIKNKLTEHLIELVFAELFNFKFTQSDPNFANFRYKADTQQLVLLDFGACKVLNEQASQGYRNMASAMQAQDTEAMNRALLELGLLNSLTPPQALNTVLKACLTASESLQVDTYNFKQTKVIKRLQEQTKSLLNHKNAIASPDFDVALINRKITGTVLLANKMNADVRLGSLIAPYIA